MFSKFVSELALRQMQSKTLIARCCRLVFLAVCAMQAVYAQNVGMLTVNKPVAPAKTNLQYLVRHDDVWQLHKGTNAPQENWETLSEVLLDSSWAAMPGGFGYGDAGIAGESTTLSDMMGRYSTIFIRRTFQVASTIPDSKRMSLVVDYDDGFVAYLDGIEIARANTTNAPGAPVTFNQTTGNVSHEASCCNAPVHAASVITITNVSMPIGNHILAVVGLNQSISSSDGHLIVDLILEEAAAGPELVFPENAILWTNSLFLLTGSNTIPNTARIAINGDTAAYSSMTGLWQREQVLEPGLNRLHVQALDANGLILSNIVCDVIYESSARYVGGLIDAPAFWTNVNEIIHVTNSIGVMSHGSLTIGAGTVVLINRGTQIGATNGGKIDIAGTADKKVYFMRRQNSNNWSQITGFGTNTTLTIRHADICGGQTTVYQGASGLFEDTYFHDFRQQGTGTIFNQPLVLGYFPQQVVVRRCHFKNYYETLWRNGLYLVEDCLFEDMVGDAFDFDGAFPGSTLRRSTFRNGRLTNVDAVDVGPDGSNLARGVTIDQCLMHDFPYDKGVSIGEWSSDITVKNCLMYNLARGIQVKDTSSANIYNNTITEVQTGLHGFQKTSSYPGGGIITNNYNNILWNCTNAFVLETNSVFSIEFSLAGGTNWPGEGMINTDPLFVDRSRRDYRLATNSPCIATGKLGSNMGAPDFTGGVPTEPLMLAATFPTTNSITLTWIDTADNEEAFLIQRRTNNVAWTTIAAVSRNNAGFVDVALPAGIECAYRICASNQAGVSEWSNPAKSMTMPAMPVTTNLLVGGVIATNTTWSGAVWVRSNVYVQAGSTLSVLAGTVIKVTNGVSIAAQAGSAIEIMGSPEFPVQVLPANGSSAWGTLSASGSGASLTIRHAEIYRGGVSFSSQATGLVEDTYVHHVTSAIVGNSARFVTLRRVHVSNYSETIFNSTLTLAEDSLFENMSDPNSDALELQGSPRGSIIRRCTFRNSTGSNSDAVDFNGSSGVTVEDCLIYNFTDKGISLGAAGDGGAADYDITIRNCLIHHVNIGMAIKDGSTVSISQCTVADSVYGMRLYQKFNTPKLGGRVTNSWNNIIWGVTEAVNMQNDSLLVADYSCFERTNWPGIGNITLDPLFLSSANYDYRLSATSPCKFSGSNDLDMGFYYPLGGLPSIPSLVSAVPISSGSGVIEWQNVSSNTAGFELEISTNETVWTQIDRMGGLARKYVLTNLLPEQTYYVRLRSTNFIGSSFNSPALAFTTQSRDSDGDGIPDAFETAFGLDPANPLDAALDLDGDGLSNLNEYRAGTDPTNKSSVFKAATLNRKDNWLMFTFDAKASKSYSLQYRDSIATGTWHTIRNYLPASTNRMEIISEPLTNAASRYYRIVSPAP